MIMADTKNEQVGKALYLLMTCFQKTKPSEM